MDNQKRLINSIIDINTLINEAVSALFFGLFFYYYYFYAYGCPKVYAKIVL